MPIDVLLFCPVCHAQHIDKPDPKHVLYKQEDMDKPGGICDTNGDMVLSCCRRCGEYEAGLDKPCWDNPPHKSHLCHNCGCVWRPADVETNGVEKVGTRGVRDTYPDKGGG